MAKEFEVKQLQKNIYTFIRESDSENEEVEVFLLSSSDGEPIKFLKKTDDNKFEILLELDRRPYFLIKSKSGEYKVAERTLPVSGMNNFRDMGGYKANNGKRVKWGVLYRSDHIHNATEDGLEYLRQLNLKTIVDYRSDNEVSKYPNPIIHTGVTSFQLDPSAHVAELAAQFQSSKEDEDINLINKIIEQQKSGQLVDHSEVVYSQYRTFAEGKESKTAFSKMLTVLANPNSPASVQHCRGGKDRTGYGAMLLLGILGVSKEDLIQDYLITGKNREERNRVKMEGYRKLTTDEKVLDHLYSFIDTKSDFIEASINSIIDGYGSIEQYAISELDIDKEIIDRLREMYLE